MPHAPVRSNTSRSTMTDAPIHLLPIPACSSYDVHRHNHMMERPRESVCMYDCVCVLVVAIQS
ncbi:hypothetical protein BCR42DRAFT_428167 [Absidia repens]|uniref:Uncharacterized protein n=1 Tax=Absidia repens TaxID=90262 RepID=A0A1X2HYS2_9FUNG|nr:hypothetical protein BCR42DRAFT_428167 [Absidia repens]